MREKKRKSKDKNCQVREKRRANEIKDVKREREEEKGNRYKG